ncbi:hypothetical protein CYMTET_14146 [Cymbomonas tetramitiformis]|uniref:Myb-like domain-containing protein n=1 Tax=Cymbomonas tetramitiformis TaxID=36881 RepID=A0AAE0GGK8_9CHLO|nr:hypothetical protein CYMTET_14146 [Cymbomonas tetramitiformis]
MPATNGARKEAERLGVILCEVAPSKRWGITAEDVRRHSQAAQRASSAAQTVSARTAQHAEQLAHKKRRCESTSVEQHPETACKRAALAPSVGRDDTVCGDPLRVDGKRVRVIWPMEDDTASEFRGVVRWLPQRAAEGCKRTYEVAFDDGDVRLTQLVGRVAFTVMEGSYKKHERESVKTMVDPLLMDGNRVRVTWPMEDGTASEFNGVVRWVPQRASQGRSRVYKVEFDDGDVRLTRLVGRVAFTVIESDYIAGRHWTEQEENALLLRKKTNVLGETWASLGVSFGRSSGAVHRRWQCLSDPAYMPQSGAGNRHTGCRIGWRKVLSKVLQGFPEQQSSLSQILRTVKELPEVIGRLDTSLSPGEKTVCAWNRRVAECLCHSPEFVRISNRKKGGSVYKYFHIERPIPRPKAKKRTDMSMNYVKAFRK